MQFVALAYFLLQLTIIVTARFNGQKSSHQQLSEGQQWLVEAESRLNGKLDAMFARILEAELVNAKLVEDVDRRLLDVVHSACDGRR